MKKVCGAFLFFIDGECELECRAFTHFGRNGDFASQLMGNILADG